MGPRRPMGGFYNGGILWFGSRFKDCEMSYRAQGESLKFVHKISERVATPPLISGNICEAIAVYEADVLSHGKRTGTQVIVKVYMQYDDLKLSNECPLTRRIPNLIGFVEVDAPVELPPDPKIFSSQAEELSESYVEEKEALEDLMNAGCTCTPAIYATFEKQQSDDLHVPGGFIDVVVMQKLPGKTIKEVWDPEKLSAEMQYQIRSKFEHSLLEVWSHGIYQFDSRPANLLWDQENSKCYFIDFEQVHREDPAEQRLPSGDKLALVMDMSCMQWGLWSQKLGNKLRRQAEQRRGE